MRGSVGSRILVGAARLGLTARFGENRRVATVDRFRTDQAPPGLLDEIRELCNEAFESDFTEHDWEHALGGRHVVVHDRNTLVAHAAVVARELRVDERPFAAGYVEAVVTRPDRQGRGFGSLAMRELETCLRARFELGALSTGRHGFYERLGWRRWAGPTFVETSRGRVRTEDEDDGLMVLPFGPSRDVSLTAALSCLERPGDDW